MNWSEKEIRGILADAKTNGKGSLGQVPYSRLVFRMLQSMYKRQTHSEQISESTHVLNGVGFNSADADLLSSIAKASAKYDALTEKQTMLVAKRMLKYSKQLAEIAQSKLQAKLPLVAPPAEPDILQAGDCEYCGAFGHHKSECDIYWSNAAAELEAKQEAAAFMAGL